ncbi:fibrinogen C domain-containing protein 1-like isoform X2 [Littorina saxatilis]|uniref:Fibrinogen C-terminal domain-containing protein n=1 Tax=Littorina saxatilis TaxID=31220 RepID=A0AAN9G159_9CAEN
MLGHFVVVALIQLLTGGGINGDCDNTCATNPKRDCSCFESRLSREPYGFNTFIQPDRNLPAFEVQCSNLDGKLWTVIQAREEFNAADLAPDGFDRTYAEYRDGFGKLTGNYWLGLHKVHALTTAVDMSMRLEMYNAQYDLLHGQYDVFRVAGASHNYRLTVAGHSGNAASTIASDSNGQQFSAKGQDSGGDECPAKFKAGWWYAKGQPSCATCTPNGPLATDQLGQMGCDTNGFGRERATSVTMLITPESYLAK